VQSDFHTGKYATKKEAEAAFESTIRFGLQISDLKDFISPDWEEEEDEEEEEEDEEEEEEDGEAQRQQEHQQFQERLQRMLSAQRMSGKIATETYRAVYKATVGCERG
jgi:FtsZ-interacting cell division protein YlmF